MSFKYKIISNPRFYKLQRSTTIILILLSIIIAWFLSIEMVIGLAVVCSLMLILILFAPIIRKYTSKIYKFGNLMLDIEKISITEDGFEKNYSLNEIEGLEFINCNTLFASKFKEAMKFTIGIPTKQQLIIKSKEGSKAYDLMIDSHYALSQLREKIDLWKEHKTVHIIER